MQNNFQVKAGKWEGPFEVLLDLIERKKLHISAISLAEITDDYIEYLNSHPGMPAATTAQFVLVASTLMLIKSISLLPNLKLTEEETTNIEDLEQRLKIYAEMRERARALGEQWQQSPIFFPFKERPFTPVFAPTDELTQNNLLTAIKNLLANLPTVETIPEKIVRKIISLEEVIDGLAKRIQTAISFKWSELSGEHQGEKASLIISFLGLLELVKRGVVEIKQSDHFADMEVANAKPRPDLSQSGASFN